MHVPSVSLAPNALIVGCGYVGTRLAERLIDEGVVVYGTTRSSKRINELASLGVRPMVVNVERRKSVENIEPILNVASLDVYVLVPPGRNVDEQPTPRQVVIDGLTNLLDMLQQANVRRMLMASSTGVYSHSGAARVDADTPAEPSDHRGQLLLDGERLWLDASSGAHVVRFAGLYGPGRVIGMDAVRAGQPIVGDGQAFLNLIHGDDAAALMMSIMTAETPGRVELGCDGQPVRRIDYYSAVASHLGVAPPRIVSDAHELKSLGLDAKRLRRVSSKRCDPTVTIQRTGWTPAYADYRTGLDAIFSKESA